MNWQYKQLSESALIVSFGEEIEESLFKIVTCYKEALQAHPFFGMQEIVPGYTNFCVYYDVFVVQAQAVKMYIDRLFKQVVVEANHSGRLVEIPVVYGGEAGPDLAYVASSNGLTEQEVIAIHSGNDYLVYMLGFAPGFPFLGGLDARIHTPRKETPRLSVAAGSVGIAGQQTGVYSLATPGGWQIIGRTDAKLFSPTDDPPALLRAGDRVRFVEVKSC